MCYVQRKIPRYILFHSPALSLSLRQIADNELTNTHEKSVEHFTS
jgi:hypothetical protein